jgi:hypothetical protein
MADPVDDPGMVTERRSKRSDNWHEALQYLVEALCDRSDARAVALIDAQGRVVAGTGTWRDLQGLATITPPLARGEACESFETATEGTDYFAHCIGISGRTLYLAALGTHLRRMHETVKGVFRILGPAPSRA